MTIRFDGFPKKYRSVVRGKTPSDAGYSWGLQSRQIARDTIGKLSLDTESKRSVSRSLAYMKSAATEGIFMYGGVNYLARYMDTFNGFCSGVGIDELRCAAAQMELGIGCQTVFAQNDTGSVNFFHMEENVDDSDITRMYWNAQSGHKPSSIGDNEHIPTYDYRIVDWKVPGEDLLFFSYPGLATGGASMGVNNKTGSIVVVDTINPLSPAGLFWHNALASMIFSAGTISALRFFSTRLQSCIPDSNGFSGGYAIHMLESSGAMMSLEFGGSFIKVLYPQRDGKNRFIAQTNYPRTKPLRDMDKYSIKQSETDGATARSIHLAMSARARTRRLVHCATDMYPTGGSAMENLRHIHRTLDAFHGDWEQSGDVHVSNGVFSVYVAAYLTGTCVGGNCTVVFHAPVLGKKSIRWYQWWPLGEKLPWGRNLYAEAEKKLGYVRT